MSLESVQDEPSVPTNLTPEDGNPGGEAGGAISPELKDLAGKAFEYHESALSENTRKAYQRGWKDLVSQSKFSGAPHRGN